MPYVVKYLDFQHKTLTVDFSSHKAVLPVIQSNGLIEKIIWGKRHEEIDPYFPSGGCVNLEMVHTKAWQKFHPRSVMLPIHSYMEKDFERTPHWFHLQSDEAIQGLVITYNDVARVYIVTVDIPTKHLFHHNEWPRLIPRQ